MTIKIPENQKIGFTTDEMQKLENASNITEAQQKAIHAFKKLLPKKEFIRIHRSYVVSINKNTAYATVDIEIGTLEIPIGQTYKERIKKMYTFE